MAPSNRLFGLSSWASSPPFPEQSAPAATESREPETREVQGRLFEVLPGYGLAHFKADDGCVYGVSRNTPGIVFADLREGQLVRCTVTTKRTRVLSASIVA